jgi:NADPH-dependent F420 reductase
VRIAVVGGTGDFGLALAQRLVEAGHDVVIGSRDAARAAAKAVEVGAAGAANGADVSGADLVVLAVKAEAALATAESLADALGGDVPVLSVASELRFTKQGVLPGEDVRSIAERTQALLHAPVVSGLHSLAAASLAHGKAEGDALVCGDQAEAKEIVLELVGAVVTGRALDAGPLGSSRALEGMTAVIVNLNKRYRAHAGVQITGLP